MPPFPVLSLLPVRDDADYRTVQINMQRLAEWSKEVRLWMQLLLETYHP